MPALHPAAGPTPQEGWIRLAIYASLVVVFAIDVATPLGYADWLGYLLPLSATLLQRDARMPWKVALLAVIGTVAGYALAQIALPGTRPVSIVNRALGGTSFLVIGSLIAQSLVHRAEARRQLWLQQTQATLAEQLVANLEPEALGERALQVLAAQTGAVAGAVYRRDGAVLRLAATMGARRADLSDPLPLGEGLLGEVARSGSQQVLSPVPAGHLALQSALARSAPAHLLLVALKADQQVVGALELALLRDEIHQPTLLQLGQRLGDVVGVALHGALVRREHQALLEETQRQAEELQTQQEELRVSNEQLEDQARALEQANRWQAEFLANMSHELRTPLNSTLILSRLLKDNADGRLSPQEVAYAQAIHESGSDLLALINDILDLSRLESGHVELQAEPMPLMPLLQRLERQFGPQARDKGLQLRLDVDPSSPAAIAVDPLRLQQVLRNLLSNALKFTAEGEVVLRLAPGGDGGVELTVSDTGPGIPAHLHGVIFEAFRQADGSTSRRYGGTGLGLAIVRELVQRMGGAVGLRSEPGQGSAFSVRLPAKPPAAATVSGPRLRHRGAAPAAGGQPGQRAMAGVAAPDGPLPWWGLAASPDAGASGVSSPAAGSGGTPPPTAWAGGAATTRATATAIATVAAMAEPAAGPAVTDPAPLPDTFADGVPVAPASAVPPLSERAAALTAATADAPARQPSATVRPLRAPVREQPLKGRSILVAERDVRSIFTLSSLLEPLGARVEVARSGAEALQRLGRGPAPDLVLLDAASPELDGAGTLRALRSQPALARLPVFSLAEQADDGQRAEMLQAGASEHLVKPLDGARLAALSRLWLSR